MIKGLAGAIVWSEDIQKSLVPFYRDVIGLAVANDTPEFVVFGSSPGAPAFCLGTHSEVKGNNADPARHMVGLGVDDAQEEYTRLKSKGVEFLDEPTTFPNIILCTFKDPEGNYVQLLQPIS
jgi:predicted enzyme related to lactoylglutathione lyase